MLLDSYKTEIEIVRAMSSEKIFIINFSHKLERDMNVSEFLKKLDVNALNYDNLERMEAYGFDKSLKATFKVMSAFEQLLLNSKHLEGKSGEEIAAPCRTFPDYIGQRILYLLGHMPLLEAIHLKLQYKELKGMKSSKESDELCKELLEEKLFNRESFRYKRFPDTKVFKDCNLINQKVDFEVNEYESGLKVEISEKIAHLLSAIGCADDRHIAYQQIGIAYWDSLKEQQSRQKNAMHASLTEVIKALTKAEQQNAEI